MLFDDRPDIVLQIGFAIQRGYECTAIHTVAVVHDMTHIIGHFVGRLRHAGTHEPDIVGFDLKVYVIGMEVEFGLSRLGRKYAVEIILRVCTLACHSLNPAVAKASWYFFVRLAYRVCPLRPSKLAVHTSRLPTKHLLLGRESNG